MFKKTSLRLEKEEKITGEISYYIFLGYSCQKCISVDLAHPEIAAAEAQQLFAEYKEREKAGYPRRTVIEEIFI